MGKISKCNPDIADIIICTCRKTMSMLMVWCSLCTITQFVPSGINRSWSVPWSRNQYFINYCSTMSSMWYFYSTWYQYCINILSIVTQSGINMW